MKRLIFPLLLIAGWAVVLVIFATPEPPHGHGVPHERIANMDQGGPGLERHRSVFVSSWIFGTILIALFVSLLAWGTLAGCDPRFTLLDGGFLLGGVVFEAVFTAICLAYYRSVTEPPPIAMWGALPSATAWLLYGLSLAPGIFVLWYVVMFRRWIAPPANLERFSRLVQRTRQG